MRFEVGMGVRKGHSAVTQLDTPGPQVEDLSRYPLFKVAPVFPEEEKEPSVHESERGDDDPKAQRLSELPRRDDVELSIRSSGDLGRKLWVP